MERDLTVLDPMGWEAVKKSLNQRVVIVREKLLRSKKNRVWAVETDVRPVIVKRSLSGKAGTEFEMLVRARSAGLDVPLPLMISNDYIVMEYLAGDSCELMINHMFSAETARNLGIWLARFHSVMGDADKKVAMNDAVLSNFIVSDGRVYGFDLEDSSVGDPLDDLGQLTSSILGSEPYFTPIKFDLCYRLLESYEMRTGSNVRESVRPYAAKHLKQSAQNKPIFRRTYADVADSIIKGWPKLA